MAFGGLWFRSRTGAWYCTVDGKQERVLKGTIDDRDQAHAIWDQLRLKYEAEHGSAQLNGNRTLQEVWSVYQLAELPKRTTARQKRIKEKMQPFVDSLRDIQMKDLKSWQVESWVYGQVKWCDNTKSLACKTLSLFFNWCVFRDIIATSPMRGWKRPQESARGEEVAIRPDDYAALLAHAREYMRDILSFLWSTGCRPSECLSATTPDYERLPDGTGFITLKKHKSSHKTDKPREIIVPSPVCAIIDRRISRQGDGIIFRGPTGAAITSQDFQQRLKSLARKAKIDRPIIAYGFRHRFAISMLEAGMPHQDVAALLGHTSPKHLHRHYAHTLARLRHKTKDYSKYFDLLNAQPPTQ